MKRPARLVRSAEDDDAEKALEELLPGLKLVGDVEPEEILWVWYPYIPAGKMTILEGDPGLGKSWIATDVAARLSTGNPFPGEDAGRPPQKVLMLSAEDGIAETIRPRLDALGADVSRIYADDVPFTLSPQNVQRLEEVMRRIPATITFIDPIVGYIGDKVDMYRPNEVRALMNMLQGAAKRTGSAVLLVRHLRKSDTTNKKYSGIGSIDFTAAVRSQLQVGETKRGRTFMEHVKHNLTPKGETLGYEITDGRFRWTGGMDWRDEERKGKSEGGIERAKVFLRETLAYGPIKNTAVMALAREEGISSATLSKAKQGIAHSRKVGSAWHWELDAPPLPSEEEVLNAT